MAIKIRLSLPNDVYEIRQVQRITWLNTYPNTEIGITAEDIHQKFEIDKTAEGQQKLKEKMKGYQDKNINRWVAEDKGHIVAFCIATKAEKHHRINAIYVLPDYQRQGLGKQLLNLAFAWLGDKKDIFLNAASYNQPAINFYHQQGFIETDTKIPLDNLTKLPSGKYIPEVELVKKCS